MIKKIRKLRKDKELGLFIISSVVLGFILKLYVSSGESLIIEAKRLRTSWLIGTLIIAYFYHIIFGSNSKNN